MIDFHVCTLEAASSACVLDHDPKAADTQLLLAFMDGMFVLELSREKR